MMNERFWISAVLAAVAMWLVPLGASAQTPTYGNLELRFGPYYPEIDKEEGLQGSPFSDTFGDKGRLLFELEVGMHLYQDFGKLGVAATAGYSNFGGDAELGGPAPTEDGEQQVPRTNFNVVPFRGSVYYRFDYTWTEWRIPLVPVFKAGLDYYWWEAEDGNSDTASYQGEKGTGFRPGWHASASLHLLLNIIDQRSAASFDLNWGINRTYLFAEYLLTRVDGFGSPGLDLSDSQWMVGLSFEF